MWGRAGRGKWRKAGGMGEGEERGGGRERNASRKEVRGVMLRMFYM